MLERWEPVIGLEVHVQLSTRSKIFCGCSTAFGAPANSHTCPTCLGLPGALPVFNLRVAEMAAALGLALGCEVRERSVWARKNYFYADLPKGYQISQFAEPICEHGALRFFVDGDEGEEVRVAEASIVRIHMEEDAGKSVHDGGGGHSRVDLNRAGVPLLEVVSAPDLRSPEEAAGYLKALRSIVRYLGISDGNMQEGSLRCDANVSLRPRGERALGTRAEVKNLNSFRFVAKAITHEILRQAELLEEGGVVEQETRLYDSERDETRTMRSKEEAEDYRYFPDPDLPPLHLDAALLERARARLTELPVQRAERWVAEHGLSVEDARTLSNERGVAEYFEAAVQAFDGPGAVPAKWIVGEVLRELGERNASIEALGLAPDRLAELMALVEADTISSSAGKQVFAALLGNEKRPRELVAELGLEQVSDSGALEAVVAQVIRDFPDQAATYRGGKKGILAFLMGQVMKASGGKANPKLASEALRQKLEEE
ncbi:MAG: Asp-tRNA(Asn)/Glu-tRNA(Gln) amidotransferase subunit GatB [Deltaproteobacteria bacterium]|nr:Asp-tRNA(Asn)/Glu-tRNA(Gln) amidotransferase subunit GatB [Deltaproteobacteria bacterium]